MMSSCLAAPPRNRSLRDVAPRLQPLLSEVGATARDYLRASADALTARREGPTAAWVNDALAAYMAEVASMRQSGQLSDRSRRRARAPLCARIRAAAAPA